MADIFISYSRQDSEQADLLAKLLISAGLTVWIDRSSIEAATSWSGEITRAIGECRVLLVMLSPASVCSKNVAREVSLGFERDKRLLPVELEPIMLPDDMAYQLAGLQRAPFSDIQQIVRALEKLGLKASTTPANDLHKADLRKSLMILPFDDLSPEQDNEWFADGIVSELVNSLSNVKALRLTDPQTTKEFRSYNGSLKVYAEENRIRYFVQGDVRKYGDQVKISSRLLDIHTGEYLWKDSHRGSMQDIFEIQEAVAQKVVDGLHVVLSSAEQNSLRATPTLNAGAYELLMRGEYYLSRATRAGCEQAIKMFREAVELDPNCVQAKEGLVHACIEFSRFFNRDPTLLEQASEIIQGLSSLVGETSLVLGLRSRLALTLGAPEEALKLAQEAVRVDPRDTSAFLALGFACQMLGQKEAAVAAWKRMITPDEENIGRRYLYLVSVYELGDAQRLETESTGSLPLFAKRARLFPDDMNAQIEYATILHWAGREADARDVAEALEQRDDLDALTICQLACLRMHQRNHDQALALLARSVQLGLREIETLRRIPDFDPVRERPEFKAIIQTIEDAIALESNV